MAANLSGFISSGRGERPRVGKRKDTEEDDTSWWSRRAGWSHSILYTTNDTRDKDYVE